MVNCEATVVRYFVHCDRGLSPAYSWLHPTAYKRSKTINSQHM